MENWSGFNDCSCILLPIIITVDFLLLIINLNTIDMYGQHIAVISVVVHHWLLQKYE